MAFLPTQAVTKTWPDLHAALASVGPNAAVCAAWGLKSARWALRYASWPCCRQQ